MTILDILPTTKVVPCLLKQTNFNKLRICPCGTSDFVRLLQNNSLLQTSSATACLRADVLGPSPGLTHSPS